MTNAAASLPSLGMDPTSEQDFGPEIWADVAASVDALHKATQGAVGDVRARHLIRWFNEGAGGKIAWGTPGDFMACVRIAERHMRPDQAKGFCNLRHQDATGAAPGNTPAERALRTARHKSFLGLLRRADTEGEERVVAEKRQFSADQLKALAKKGWAFTSADGTIKFPIEMALDLHNAIQAFAGRAKAAEKPAIKRYITRRARELKRTDMLPAGWSTTKAAGVVILKADEERRYTFGPWYPAAPAEPSAADLDAHGDYATAEDVQDAVWDYVRAGDRALRLQHTDGTEIGECVELVSWPYEVSMPLTLADGSNVTKTFAPGTAFMGAVWTEQGWSYVKDGLITGYSVGGSAEPILVDIAE